jgi:hypothetical protein
LSQGSFSSARETHEEQAGKQLHERGGTVFALSCFDLLRAKSGQNHPSSKKIKKIKGGGSGTHLAETEHAALDDWHGYRPTALDGVEIFVAHEGDKGKLGEIRAGG